MSILDQSANPMPMPIFNQCHQSVEPISLTNPYGQVCQSINHLSMQHQSSPIDCHSVRTLYTDLMELVLYGTYRSVSTEDESDTNDTGHSQWNVTQASIINPLPIHANPGSTRTDIVEIPDGTSITGIMLVSARDDYRASRIIVCTNQLRLGRLSNHSNANLMSFKCQSLIILPIQSQSWTNLTIHYQPKKPFLD